MNLGTFIEKVMEIVNDSGIRKELEKGLRIQFTIDKEETNIIALSPKSGALGRSKAEHYD